MLTDGVVRVTPAWSLNDSTDVVVRDFILCRLSSGEITSARSHAAVSIDQPRAHWTSAREWAQLIELLSNEGCGAAATQTGTMAVF